MVLTVVIDADTSLAVVPSKPSCSPVCAHDRGVSALFSSAIELSNEFWSVATTPTPRVVFGREVQVVIRR
jgi:hypothetical protein